MRGPVAPLDADYEERAIYVVDGEIEVAGDRFVGPRLLIFRPGDRISVRAIRGSRMMFLGGSSGGPALHLVEFRFLAPGADRTGQGGLEDGPFRAGA
jgi:redox-sensitive bicupin YhaK (pirin superfamily)